MRIDCAKFSKHIQWVGMPVAYDLWQKKNYQIVLVYIELPNKFCRPTNGTTVRLHRILNGF